jgi:hypothetical protein
VRQKDSRELRQRWRRREQATLRRQHSLHTQHRPKRGVTGHQQASRLQHCSLSHAQKAVYLGVWRRLVGDVLALLFFVAFAVRRSGQGRGEGRQSEHGGTDTAPVEAIVGWKI